MLLQVKVRLVLGATLGLAALTGVAGAQCQLAAVPGFGGASGLQYPAHDIHPSPTGDGFVVAGWFLQAGGIAVSHIAHWNGHGVWSDLGGGANDTVFALATTVSGELVAGGDFTVIGGVAANRVARWDGTQWHPFGGGLAGLQGTVRALLPMPDGSLLAGGNFAGPGGGGNSLARWDGTSWQTFGGGCDWFLTHLGLAPNGDVFAVGTFTQIGGVVANGVARWDGSTWHPLGVGIGGYMNGMAVLPNGDLVVSGNNAALNTPLSLWNGSGWSKFPGWGGHGIGAIDPMPNGDLIVAGTLLGWPFGVSRWDGSAWTRVATADTQPGAVAVSPSGDIAATGHFTQLGGGASYRFGVLRTTCPAEAQIEPLGGCSSSGGANQLSPTNRPWIGTTYRATASGLPTTALLVEVVGVSQNAVQLSQLAPQGQPGCFLMPTPDSMRWSLTANGQAETALAIPPAAALVGVKLHQQVIPLELDPAGNVVAITATNRLVLTIGAF